MLAYYIALQASWDHGKTKLTAFEINSIVQLVQFCGISGRTGTYCEQPRHSEYGLGRFVAAQASSSTGLKAILRPAAGKQSFYE